MQGVGRWKDFKTMEPSKFFPAGGEPTDISSCRLPTAARLIWEENRTAAGLGDFTAFDNSLRRLIPAA